MIHIYFISPKGASVVQKALQGLTTTFPNHSWRADGDDEQVIGILSIKDDMLHELAEENALKVVDAFGAAGIHILPNHRSAESIAPEHHALLKQHGVAPTDTTKQALAKVHGVSGFPPLKPKRF